MKSQAAEWASLINEREEALSTLLEALLAEADAVVLAPGAKELPGRCSSIRTRAKDSAVNARIARIVS